MVANIGIQVNDNFVYTLQCANYQVVISRDKSDMEYMMRMLIKEYKKGGLELIWRRRNNCV